MSVDAGVSTAQCKYMGEGARGVVGGIIAAQAFGISSTVFKTSLLFCIDLVERVIRSLSSFRSEKVGCAVISSLITLRANIMEYQTISGLMK